MRNRFGGVCYRCGKHCPAGEGHFEKVTPARIAQMGPVIQGQKWLVQHAECAKRWYNTNYHFNKVEHLKAQNAPKTNNMGHPLTYDLSAVDGNRAITHSGLVIYNNVPDRFPDGGVPIEEDEIPF